MNKSEQLGFLNQFPVKTDAASWRQEEITLAPNELKTVNFSDSMPNMFFIQNTNDVPVFVGITKIPTTSAYERCIDANTCGTFGRPVPTRTLHILNHANKEITITLFSVYDKFDINILKDFSFTGSIGQIVNDGIIKGFSNGVALPHGSNHIGEVSVEVLPEGNNTLGKVNFGEDALAKVNDIIENLSIINREITDFLFYEQEESANGFTKNFTDESFIPNYINFIANDDDSESITVTLTLTNNKVKTFTLKKGDVFSDVNISVSAVEITPKTEGKAVSWRCLFGKKGV